MKSKSIEEMMVLSDKGKKRYAYLITDSKVSSYSKGNILFSEQYLGERMENLTYYDEENTTFYNPVRGVFLGRIEGSQEAMEEVVKSVYFDLPDEIPWSDRFVARR